jgi:antibiotic biosynthesis monooxygenase (ABM) superfamily enzyme
MLTKIRRLKVKQTIDGLFDVGEILYEYYDYPEHFYSLNKEHDDLFNPKIISEYGGFDMWFEELKPIKKEKSPQYKLLITK